jgi:hypothetical protein
MAEVGLEESIVSSIELSVVSHNSSWSHDTLISAGSFISIGALNDDSNVSGHGSWSTEWMIWDQVSAIVESTSRWAIS